MNRIIKELLENGIDVKMHYNKSTKQVEYIVDGFYKSDTIRLMEQNDSDTLFAIARYTEETFITSLLDIVQLNFDWWQRSKDRFDGWSTPDSKWVPLLLKYSFFITSKAI